MSKLTLDKHLIVWYIITMKRWIYKHLLRAKYELNGRYYWKLSTAITEANKGLGKQVVRKMNWATAYTKRGVFHTVHPDANNYNPYQ